MVPEPRTQRPRPCRSLQTPAGRAAHQETVDELRYLSELVAAGAILPLESFHEHDGRRKEARFQNVVLCVRRGMVGPRRGSWQSPGVPSTPQGRGRAPRGAHVAAAGVVVDHPGDDVVYPGQDLRPGVCGHLPVAEQGGAADPLPVHVGVRLLQAGRVVGCGALQACRPPSPPQESGLAG